MNKKDCVYKIINLFILIITALILINKYLNFNWNSVNSKCYCLIFICSVFIIHSIKFLRLYIALYGNNINVSDYIKTYCKVTPVSLIFPFKFGDLYRIYCYGYLLKNWVKGCIVILLDRFIDTAALISILAILLFLNNSKGNALFFMLLIFLLSLMLLYKIFPGFYSFWKNYYLSAKSTKRKLWSLKHLELLNGVYIEIVNIIRGKGIILYFLSIIAWIVEIFNLVIILKLNMFNHLSMKISEYLNSALCGNQTYELSLFIFISIIILAFLYLLIKFIELIKKEDCK